MSSVRPLELIDNSLKYSAASSGESSLRSASSWALIGTTLSAFSRPSFSANCSRFTEEI